MWSELKNHVDRPVTQVNDYHESATLAQKQTGKSLSTQLREIRTLTGTGGRWGVSDYCWYKLCDAAHFPSLKLQHWDAAFCTEGLVLMELKTEADLGVPQFLGQIPFIGQNGAC